MAKSETYYKWIETGYDIFAHHGPDGLHVEKLSRSLKLNKSGFYHYFGDFENFCQRMVKHHELMIELFLNDIPGCPKIDPDFLNILLKHKLTIMAQIQMVRNENNQLFSGVYIRQDTKAWHLMKNIWGNHINIDENPELSLLFYNLVRDMFYTRITWDNFNFAFLLSLSDEIYNTVTKILSEKERLGTKRQN